jgi:hypothetical protein
MAYFPSLDPFAMQVSNPGRSNVHMHRVDDQPNLVLSLSSKRGDYMCKEVCKSCVKSSGGSGADTTEMDLMCSDKSKKRDKS